MKELFAAIIAFVQAAEQVYPEGGKGKEKFDLVAGQILAFAPLVGLAVEFAERLMPLFKAFIDMVVLRYNTSGLFKTTPKVDTP